MISITYKCRFRIEAQVLACFALWKAKEANPPRSKDLSVEGCEPRRTKQVSRHEQHLAQQKWLKDLYCL
jgi:hypothetical protein